MRFITLKILTVTAISIFIQQAAHAVPTENNDTLLFQGTLGSVNTTLISPSGHSFAVNGTFNVNNTSYDGLGGFDTVFFTNQNDFLEAGAVRNIESFIAGNGNDVVDARFSNVRITVLGGTGGDVFFGGLFNDVLLGDSGNDILDGNDGDDFLDGGRGLDLLIGGLGSDTYSISGFNALDTIIEAASEDINTVQFGRGVSLDTITFETVGADLLLSIDGNGQLLIKDQFAEPDSGIDTLRFRGSSPFDLRTLNGPQTSVPEPGTLALFALGLIGLACAQRRGSQGIGRLKTYAHKKPFLDPRAVIWGRLGRRADRRHRTGLPPHPGRHNPSRHLLRAQEQSRLAQRAVPMSGVGKRTIAVLAALAVAFPVLSSPAQSEMFTSGEFLEWPKESQRGYLQSSIGMASIIARQNRSSQGDCIDRWYFENETVTFNKVLAVMKKHTNYHPHGVILAMAEKACGPLEYTNR